MGAATPGGFLLLLGLGSLVLGWGCFAQDSFFNPDWGFTSYEVVIPRQLVTRGGGPQVSGRTTYLLRIAGKKNIIHLRPKKLLLSRHLRVFTFTEDGIGVEDQPYIPSNCNFQGSVEGAPRSKAMLSTCLGGLRGMLQIEDSVYQIEPIQASDSFEHVVYRLKDDFISNFRCGLTDQEIQSQLSKMRYYWFPTRVPKFVPTYLHQKYLEVEVVVDKVYSIFKGFNVSLIVSDIIVLVGIMDTYFQFLNARVHFKTIEIWLDHDRVNTVAETLEEILHQFSTYKELVLYPRTQTDLSHLYLQGKYSDAEGRAYVAGTCDKTRGVSASTLLEENLVTSAIWSTHELGHSVGMGHDDKRTCYCDGKVACMMAGGSKDGFSNCSFVYYYNFVTSGGECLDNVPSIAYKLEKCGNKVVENGEECDCGTVKQCEKDMCCQTNCKLKRGAQCSVGLCCTKCRFSPSGHVCRDKQNKCDLTEFCNGNSSQCPKDFYMQDGTPCSGKAYCYHKGCHDRFLQCKAIFGSGARNAPFVCYSEVNRKADRFGNCGLLGRGYRNCQEKDLLCGRLQCVNVKSVPELPDHTTAIFTQVKEFNIRCWGTDYHSGMVGMALPDAGVVKDGTTCGTDLICIQGVCHNISVLHYDCQPEKCNHRGVCNNLKNCHCNYGWAPPFCETPGYGGSIDSGPQGKKKVVPKPLKVVPAMFIRLILLAIALVLIISKKVIGRLLNRKGKVEVQLAKTPLPKNKGKKGKARLEEKPQPPK